jgi:hypothetical protein
MTLWTTSDLNNVEMQQFFQLMQTGRWQAE